MDLWFLQDAHRFALEREAITHLMHTVDWLHGVEWGIERQLYVDAMFQVADQTYLIRLLYPPLFPSVPPTIRPQNPDERWSTHQYNDGTLCLEWGPDNWHSSVTGAQMLESAHSLLEIEHLQDQSVREIAPSRHYQTVGQELRRSKWRFFVTSTLSNYLDSLPCDTGGVIKLTNHWRKKSLLTLITSVASSGTTVWNDNSIPDGLHTESDQQGFFLKTRFSSADIVTVERWDALKTLLENRGYQIPSFSEDSEEVADQMPDAILIIDEANALHLFLALDKTPGTLLLLTSIKGSSQPILARLPRNLSGLSEKSVALIGLGSIGSKIAVSLARTGINRFYLVDEDIFLPENICRNSLDWRYVGEHKVDAIAEMLNTIVPELDVVTSRLHLTGQEATSSLSDTLEKLADYDLIIDATADPTVFNLLTAVVTTYKKSMLWMEVYGGGIGGLIARSRTGIDPHPQTMRAAYHTFTHNHPTAEITNTSTYAVQDIHGDYLVASDADVSIIASWATRLALDTLADRDTSEFPYSMYLIGLSKSWVFGAPFDTIPIATNHLAEAEPSIQSEADMSELTGFLTELLKKK
jgi:ubiquitin-protein ligase